MAERSRSTRWASSDAPDPSANVDISLQVRAAGDAPAIFDEVLSSFMGTLSPSESGGFSEHSDAESMILAIRTIIKNHPSHHSRLTTACRKFQALADQLKPYFDVVEILVQVKPEYMALIWGSMKMIFKLCLNYLAFLEKMADMFENISHVLPAYERWVDIHQKSAASRGDTRPRLAKALAFLYADIVRFCHSAYSLFAKNKPGVRDRLGFASRVAWRPFDMQYESLILRLDQHRKFLDLELGLAATEELMRVSALYEEEIRRAHIVGDISRAARQEEATNEKEIMKRRADTLKRWVSPPQWMERFEQARETRSLGTGTWILESETYKSWKSASSEAVDHVPKPRVLSLEAKPGFGKTVLCSAIIEDLGSYTLDTGSTATHVEQSVVFYFFDRRKRNQNAPAQAMRAVCTQLIHLHRFDKRAIDVASIIFKRETTGEFTASNNEVFSVLQMLLDQLEFTYLVFDGVDECSDPPEFFRLLGEVSVRSETSSILLLSRPSVKLPVILRDAAVCLNLDAEQATNENDIQIYARARLEHLQVEELIPKDFELDGLVKRISERAYGMFLWVRLLIEYLRLPSLTFHDRVDAIDNLSRLEGLDKMYAAILTELGAKFEGCSAKSVSMLFQMVAYSRRPLTRTELHYAVSVPLDRLQTSQDLLPRFDQCLGTLSGSLIELSRHGTAQFIHLSAQEYYVASSSGGEKSDTLSKLLTHRALANRNIAASCLSYLIYSVPSEPLAGLGTVPQRALIDRQYPLLRYSTSHWGDHLLQSLAKGDGKRESKESGDTPWIQFSRLLADFLRNPRAVTMWIEASWVFNQPPTVPDLPDMDFLQGHPEASTILSLARDNLAELSIDLKALRHSWSRLLKQEPNEIWEPSISAFTKSRFWLSTDKARVTQPECHQPTSGDFIVVQSQLSKDGSIIGVAKLFPPREWIDNCQRPLHGKESPDGLGQWTARYDLWAFATRSVSDSVEITLSSERMKPFVNRPQVAPNPSSKRTENEVFLPLAISEDARRIIVLDTVVVMRPDGAGNDIPLFSQVLQISGDIPVTVPIREDVTDLPDGWNAFDGFCHMKFSPSGRYLVVIRESAWRARKLRGDWYSVLWSLQIFRDDYNNREGVPGPHGYTSHHYSLVASTRFFADPDIGLVSPLRGIAFHPSAPRLAFAQVLDGLSQTFIWDFELPVRLSEEPGAKCNPFPVHEPPIFDPTFSQDGQYLYGTLVPIETTRGGHTVAQPEGLLIVRVSPADAHPAKAAPSKGKEVCRVQTNSDHQSQLNVRDVMREMAAAQPREHVQCLNDLVFDKDARGVVHISQLRLLESEGAIVLSTIGSNGQFCSETLSRLPNHIRENVDVSIVHDSNNHANDMDTGGRSHTLGAGMVRIILNKKPLGVWRKEHLNDTTFPVIIERARESIPRYSRPMSLDFGLSFLLSRPSNKLHVQGADTTSHQRRMGSCGSSVIGCTGDAQWNSRHHNSSNGDDSDSEVLGGGCSAKRV